MALPTQQLFDTIKRPFQQFIRNDSASGILLIVCTLAALAWANSPWSASYFALWETPISIAIGESAFSKPLLLWVNDGLMAIFFFTIGLEIKREVLDGELSRLRQAALPLLGAIGGMVVPVGLFFGLTGTASPGSAGWGIPMATDIAFSLGILTLLGSRVPIGMKVFLTAFAIVDDIGAVLVIALFYSHGIHWDALATAGGLFFLLLSFNFVFSIKRNWPYLVVGAILWFYMLKGGVHPTIAGVLVALTIPATNKIRLQRLINHLQGYRDAIRRKQSEGQFLEHGEVSRLEDLRLEVKNAQPPLQRMEFVLDNFVAFFVMPLFALANAGIRLQSGDGPFLQDLTLHIAVALVAGKLAGIVLFSWLGVRLGLADLPAQTRWIHMVGLALLGGIGFTMALFISNLALDDVALLNQAKLGILLGSFVAGTAGYLLLNGTIRKEPD